MQGHITLIKNDSKDFYIINAVLFHERILKKIVSQFPQNLLSVTNNDKNFFWAPAY